MSFNIKLAALSLSLVSISQFAKADCPSLAPKSYPNCRILSYGSVRGVTRAEVRAMVNEMSYKSFEITGTDPSQPNTHEFKITTGGGSVVDAQSFRGNSDDQAIYLVGSFSPDRNIVTPINDVGMISVEQKDVCVSSTEIRKTVRTVLDPASELGFPLSDNQMSYVFSPNSVTISYSLPDARVPSRGRLTQAILDAAPQREVYKLICEAAAP